MLAKEYLKCRMEQYVVSPLSKSRSFFGGGRDGGGTKRHWLMGRIVTLWRRMSCGILVGGIWGNLGGVWMVFDVF